MSDTNIFMKIDGVKGEATVIGHIGEIDVLSWQWEMHQDARGESSHKRATIENLQFVQRVNLASSSLLQMLLHSKAASEGVLTVLSPNAQASTTPLGKIVPPKPTLQIFMKRVMVHRIVPYGTAYGHFESVVISFEEFKREYTPQSIGGAACGVASVFYRMCDD
ncbi:Hcp1 family type VI secretion system effector [Caballeronia pedi]|uniref:Hcp1 family type VI secretion system effector n=1 Tax=Caballeronia pedi TaxID=1777141 RepID=A0A158A933_9BURK|nr:type VI secretion system tube protein Hcp [Caballeronia pedi]SAK54344.1 Hcp1 family type VI secretion system effector [Caballeronia pedi]